jgi:hypothetical protein
MRFVVLLALTACSGPIAPTYLTHGDQGSRVQRPPTNAPPDPIGTSRPGNRSCTDNRDCHAGDACFPPDYVPRAATAAAAAMPPPPAAAPPPPAGPTAAASPAGPTAAPVAGGPTATAPPAGPTAVPVTGGPAAAPITGGPTAAPVTGGPTAAPVTGGPAAAPVTGGPAAAPVIGGPTAAPVTGGATAQKALPPGAATPGAPPPTTALPAPAPPASSAPPLTASAPPPPTPARCLNDSQCSGQVCANGSCVAPCPQAACMAGQECGTGGHCVPLRCTDPRASICAQNSRCNPSSGACERQPCTSRSQCDGGVCFQGRCYAHDAYCMPQGY